MPDKIEITPEETAALWERLGKDVEDGLPVKAYDEWFNMDTDLDDALRKALTLAIARERTRAKEIIGRTFATLENSDAIPKLMMQAALEERDRIIALLLEAGHDENDAVIAKIRSGE